MLGTVLASLYSRRFGMANRTLAWPLALAFVILLHAAGGFYVSRLRFNNSAEVYYSPDAPAIVLRDALRRDFPSDEVLTVLFRGDKLYTDDFMRRLDSMARELGQSPLVDRVITVLGVEKVAGSRDGFSVGPLVDLRATKSLGPDELRRRVLGDRFAPGAIASRDGQYLALGVRPKTLSESGERLQLKIATISALNRAGLQPYYAGDAGPVTLDVAQLDSILSDTATFVPLTVAIGLALLWWIVGRVRPVVIGALTMSTVVVPTVGAIAAFGQPYTMATAIIPSLLSAYALATLMHLYAGIQRAQAAGMKRAKRLDRALSETLKPGMFNVLTTGAGLVSLALVPIPPVQVFGVAGAAGTALVFIVVYFLMPPLLLRWDKHRWPHEDSGMGRLGRLASRISCFAIRRPKTVVGVTLALLSAVAPFARQVKVESDLLTFFSDKHPATRDTRLIESTLMGVTTLEISLKGAERDALQDVEKLRAIRSLQQWLEKQPEVDRTVSMADVVEEMHWAMNGEKAAFRELPPNNRLLRQYLLVYDGKDLYELVNRDFQHGRILVNLRIHGAHEIGAMLVRIRKQVDSAPIEGLVVEVGGQGRLFADQINLLVSGQAASFLGAFGQIFVLMVVLWRSVGAAAVCIVPNLAPLYFVFVLMGATGVYLNMATVMIAGVVLGITVDDTIHLYHSYRERLHLGASPVFAIARSFRSSGRAVLAISVLLVTQFLLLCGSDFVPTANFGLMTAVGLLAGQAFELILLPALLVLMNTPRARLAERATRLARSQSQGVASSRPSTGVETGTPPAATGLPVLPLASEVPTPPRRLLLCTGDVCAVADAETIWRRFAAAVEAAEGDAGPNAWRLTRCSCLGPCRLAPVAQVYPEGLYYGKLDDAKVDRIVAQHLGRGRVVADLVSADAADGAAVREHRFEARAESGATGVRISRRGSNSGG